MQRIAHLLLLLALACPALGQVIFPEFTVQDVDWNSGVHRVDMTRRILATPDPELPVVSRGTADVEFISGTEVHLTPGFHAGGFTGDGHFRAWIDQGVEELAITDLYPSPNGVDSVLHVNRWEKLELGLVLPLGYQNAIDSFFVHYYSNGPAGLSTPSQVDRMHDLNPYADDSLQLVMTLVKPSGTQTLKWGFFMREATWETSVADTNTAHLIEDTVDPLQHYYIRFRVAPDEEGPWQFSISLKANHTINAIGDTLPTEQYTGYDFVCDPPLPDNNGHLRVNPANRKILQFETGRSFFGLGTNIADWRRDISIADNNYQRRDHNNLLTSMKLLHEVGGNYARMYLMPKLFTPELVNLGVYDQYMSGPVCANGSGAGNNGNCQYHCWAYDQMLDQARTNGIYVQLCIDPYSFGGVGGEDRSWGLNPYSIYFMKPFPQTPPLNRWDLKRLYYTNDTNGIPQRDSGVFYYWKRKYKYLMARWGYSVNIASIEPFNEIDQSSSYFSRTVTRSCAESNGAWQADTALPSTIDSWLTDISQYVRGAVDLQDPVRSPLGESKKLFLMSYAYDDPDRPDRETFYKPFYNQSVDLMDAHMYLYPTQANSDEPDGGLKWAVDHVHGFLDRTDPGDFPDKPFNSGEFNYFASWQVNPNNSIGVDPYFLNYDVSFHNELWAGAFSGQFATGTSWQWERIFWWPNALQAPQAETNDPQYLINNPMGYSSNLGYTNVINLGGIPKPIVNCRLHHHFKPLAELLAHPSWQPYDFLNGVFTTHAVFDTTAGHDLEAYYLMDADSTVAIGWVHNRNAWVMNNYYLRNNRQNLLGCVPPDSSVMTLTGFRRNSPYTITWFSTRTNSTVFPPQMDTTSNNSGELTVDLGVYFGGIANNYLDTLQSDYAFIVTTAPFTKSRHVNTGEAPKSEVAWDFELFPNPTTDQLFLNFVDINPKWIVIFDVSGRRVFSQSSVTSRIHTLNVGHFAHGVYWVRVDDGLHRSVKKFIVH